MTALDLRDRDFISTRDWSKEEIERLLLVAEEMEPRAVNQLKDEIAKLANSIYRGPQK